MAHARVQFRWLFAFAVVGCVGAGLWTNEGLPACLLVAWRHAPLILRTWSGHRPIAMASGTTPQAFESDETAHNEPPGDTRSPTDSTGWAADQVDVPDQSEPTGFPTEPRDVPGRGPGRGLDRLPTAAIRPAAREISPHDLLDETAGIAASELTASPSRAEASTGNAVSGPQRGIPSEGVSAAGFERSATPRRLPEQQSNPLDQAFDGSDEALADARTSANKKGRAESKTRAVTSGSQANTGSENHDARGPQAPIAPPRPTNKALPIESRPLVDRATIDRLYRDGELVSAHRELSNWYWKHPELRAELLPQLEQSAQTLYFSPQPHLRPPHMIEPGEQLRIIASRHKLSWEYLARLNGVDPKRIRAGQRLKLVDGPFSAVVVLGNHELIIHQNGNFVKRYKVGIGKDGSTPVGTFTVENKLSDPTYYPPEGGVIAADDPKNPLGERWIDIGNSYGIHGTIDPGSIGRNESRGCIRLLNADVAEVYDLLVVGSEVQIVR